MLPELVELARDEGSTVRLAAFDTIINLLEMFDSGEKPHTMTPHHLCHAPSSPHIKLLQPYHLNQSHLSHKKPTINTILQSHHLIQTSYKLYVITLHPHTAGPHGFSTAGTVMSFSPHTSVCVAGCATPSYSLHSHLCGHVALTFNLHFCLLTIACLAISPHYSRSGGSCSLAIFYSLMFQERTDAHTFILFRKSL